MSVSRLREYIFRIILATSRSEDENCVVEKASEAGTSYFHNGVPSGEPGPVSSCCAATDKGIHHEPHPDGGGVLWGAHSYDFFSSLSLVPTQKTAPAGAFRQTDTRQSAQPDWAQVSLSCVIGHGGMTLPTLPLMTDSLSLFFLPSKNPPKCDNRTFFPRLGLTHLWCSVYRNNTPVTHTTCAKE